MKSFSAANVVDGSNKVLFVFDVVLLVAAAAIVVNVGEWACGDVCIRFVPSAFDTDMPVGDVDAVECVRVGEVR